MGKGRCLWSSLLLSLLIFPPPFLGGIIAIAASEEILVLALAIFKMQKLVEAEADTTPIGLTTQFPTLRTMHLSSHTAGIMVCILIGSYKSSI